VSHLIKAIKTIAKAGAKAGAKAAKTVAQAGAKAASWKLSCWDNAGAQSKWCSSNWCQEANGLAVFSYKEEFEQLWGLDGGAYKKEEGIGLILKDLNSWSWAEKDKTLTIVIVWDGMPDSGPDSSSVHSFVGPYDWALALSWRIYGFGGAKLDQIKLRVLIFDVRIEKGRSSFAARLNLLPWIRSYQVDNMEAFAEDLLKLSAPAEDLLKLSAPETTNGGYNRTRDDVGLTRDLWYQTLLKVEDRHSVANQLAPWFLAEGFFNIKGIEGFKTEKRKHLKKRIITQSSMRLALHSILRHSGFLEENEQLGMGNGDEESVLRDIVGPEIKKICPEQVVFSRRKGVKFMLVDDHFDLGYEDVLKLLLLQRGGNHCLAPFNNLEIIYEQLKEYVGDVGNGELRKQWWRQPRRLFKDKCDVLFLDLRFWDNDARRQEIMKELVDYAEKLHVEACPDENIQIALKAAKAAREEGSGFPLGALTLLPLLLSQLDRTFPIILFSSSHQRAVSEMLHHRRNIITSFAKPMISGYGERIPMTRSIYNLAHAVNKALDLHEARIVWERICAWHTNVVQDNNGRLSVTGDVKWQSPRDRGNGWHRRTRKDGSEYYVTDPIEFKFTEDDCLRLADLFETYIVGELFYEFMPCCWAFLERNIRENAEGLLGGDVERLYLQIKRNDATAANLARLLREFRDKTLHGDWGRDSFQIGDQNQVRHVALLLFCYLLTYLRIYEHSNRRRSSSRVPSPCEKETAFSSILFELKKFRYNGFNESFCRLDEEVASSTLQLLKAHSKEVENRIIYVEASFGNGDEEQVLSKLNECFSKCLPGTATKSWLINRGGAAVVMQNRAAVEGASQPQNQKKIATCIATCVCDSAGVSSVTLRFPGDDKQPQSPSRRFPAGKQSRSPSRSKRRSYR